MRGWLWFAALILAAHPVAAQNLLPARFAGWLAASSTASAAAQTQVATEHAALFRDCGQKSVEQQTYQRNGATITVTLRQLADPSYGYSAFSLLRPRPATRFRPTTHSAIGTNKGMMLIGNLLVTIDGHDLAAHARDFTALAAALKPHASVSPYPTLWQYLPAQRLIPHSDRYALDSATFQHALQAEGLSNWANGKLVGFQADSAETELARYELGGKPATLLLISYPTNQIASLRIKDFGQRFDVNPKGKTAATKPVLYAKRFGSMVGLVSGAPDKAAADHLLGQVHYQTVVTWNVPGFTNENQRVVTTADYVVGSIVGTGVLLVIALVAGLALGVIRISVKHFLPGVVFDRHHSVEILQLGLSTKPINGRDFY